MSLTSYRAAPPRVTIFTLYCTTPYFTTPSGSTGFWAPAFAGVPLRLRFASLTKPRGSYEPDEVRRRQPPNGLLHPASWKVGGYRPCPIPCPGLDFLPDFMALAPS